MAERRVRFYYSLPEHVRTITVDIPDDVDDDELSEWMLDNAPYQTAFADEWEFDDERPL